MFSLRPVLRCTTEPSGRTRSEGPATKGAWEGVVSVVQYEATPWAQYERGWAERYE